MKRTNPVDPISKSLVHHQLWDKMDLASSHKLSELISTTDPNKILLDNTLDDREKFTLIFYLSQDNLKKTNSSLYYASLAIINSWKKDPKFLAKYYRTSEEYFK